MKFEPVKSSARQTANAHPTSIFRRAVLSGRQTLASAKRAAVRYKVELIAGAATAALLNAAALFNACDQKNVVLSDYYGVPHSMTLKVGENQKLDRTMTITLENIVVLPDTFIQANTKISDVTYAVHLNFQQGFTRTVAGTGGAHLLTLLRADSSNRAATFEVADGQ